MHFFPDQILALFSFCCSIIYIMKLVMSLTVASQTVRTRAVLPYRADVCIYSPISRLGSWWLDWLLVDADISHSNIWLLALDVGSCLFVIESSINQLMAAARCVEDGSSLGRVHGSAPPCSWLVAFLFQWTACGLSCLCLPFLVLFFLQLTGKVELYYCYCQMHA